MSELNTGNGHSQDTSRLELLAPVITTSYTPTTLNNARRLIMKPPLGTPTMPKLYLQPCDRHGRTHCPECTKPSSHDLCDPVPNEDEKRIRPAQCAEPDSVNQERSFGPDGCGPYDRLPPSVELPGRTRVRTLWLC